MNKNIIIATIFKLSRDISVSIEIRLRAGRQGFGGSFPGVKVVGA